MTNNSTDPGSSENQVFQPDSDVTTAMYIAIACVMFLLLWCIARQNKDHVRVNVADFQTFGTPLVTRSARREQMGARKKQTAKNPVIVSRRTMPYTKIYVDHGNQFIELKEFKHIPLTKSTTNKDLNLNLAEQDPDEAWPVVKREISVIPEENEEDDELRVIPEDELPLQR